jgi:hypothetical protein
MGIEAKARQWRLRVSQCYKSTQESSTLMQYIEYQALWAIIRSHLHDVLYHDCLIPHEAVTRRMSNLWNTRSLCSGHSLDGRTRCGHLRVPILRGSPVLRQASFGSSRGPSSRAPAQFTSACRRRGPAVQCTSIRPGGSGGRPIEK